MRANVRKKEISIKQEKPNNKPHAGTIMAIVFSLCLFSTMFIPASLGLSPLLSITIAITVMVIVLLTLPRLTKQNTLP